MPSVNVLLEVIGGPKRVVAIDPGSPVAKTAEVLAAAVDRSLVDDDGRAKAWKVYTPTEAGGFEPVAPDSNLLVIAMAMRRLLESGKPPGFGGHGEHEGDRYLFRLRLFVPAKVAPSPPVGRSQIREDEAIDLTDLREPEPPKAEGAKAKAARRRKKAKEAQETGAPGAEAAEAPASTGPALLPVEPPPAAAAMEAGQERVAVAAPTLTAGGTMILETGLGEAGGTRLIATTVEARPVAPGAIGPAPERQTRAKDGLAPRGAKQSGVVRGGKGGKAAGAKAGKATGSPLLPFLAALGILLLVAAGAVWVWKSRGEPSDPAPGSPPRVEAATPKAATSATGGKAAVTPAAGRLSDRLHWDPMPGADAESSRILSGIQALGAVTAAQLSDPGPRTQVLAAEAQLQELCSQGGFERCDALSTAALAAYLGCRGGGCEPGGAEPHLKTAALAAERALTLAAGLTDPARKQEATRRLVLQAIRVGGLAPASVAGWAPGLVQLARQGCADAKVSALPDCVDLSRAP